MKNKRKKIGIPGWKLGENSFGATVPNLEFINSIMGEPKILYPNTNIDETIDGLYLPGGPDLNPANYNEAPSLFTGNSDLFKEFFFRKNLYQYIKAGIPIFGVCLGFQMICVYFDSKLTQHLFSPIHSNERGTKSDVGHYVYRFDHVDKKNKLIITGEKYPKVNSYHHQGVKIWDLNENLIPLTVADYEVENEKSIVESVIHKNLPIYAVQHHPEEIYDDLTVGTIETLFEYYDNHKRDNTIGTFESFFRKVSG